MKTNNMYKIPERTEAQKKYWSAYRYEEWKQEERQRRMKVIARLDISRAIIGYQVVSYKGHFVCCLFDSADENRRIINIITNLLEAVNG